MPEEITREQLREVTGFIMKDLEDKIVRLFEVKAYPIIRRFVRMLRVQEDIAMTYRLETPIPPPPVKPPTEKICASIDFVLENINKRAIEAVRRHDWPTVELALRVLRWHGDLRFVYACPLGSPPEAKSSGKGEK